MMFSKSINHFYPDLAALGGLSNSLQVALRQIGSSLTVWKAEEPFNFIEYARVEKAPRSSQVYVAAQERLFLFDFWARGVNFATGQSPDLPEAARAIAHWAESGCTSADLAGAFPFVAVTEKAGIYERGEEVEDRWQTYLRSVGIPELQPFVQAASRRPILRYLFPYTSMNTFCFSRCTGYPFTRDTPFVRPVGDGRYEVTDALEKVLGRGDAEVAAELVVGNLPPGCGPAVAGTADDLSAE